MKRLALLCSLASLSASAAGAQIPLELRSNLGAGTNPPGTEVGLAVIDLGSGDTLWVNAGWRVHAASTMKLPVLLELARRVDAGTYSWDQPVLVRNEFRSIVDSSTYTLPPEPGLDTLEGRTAPARLLASLMITRSSNFATNLLIAELGAPQVQATARALGADSIVVLRGVEDQKAFDRGLSNTTTARDLAVLLAAIGTGRAGTEASSAVMLDILSHQEFRGGIPAGLPPGTPVASKTGNITGINHDAALVMPPGRPPYVLVIVTRGFGTPADAEAYMARVSREVWQALGGAD
ncbi:MAG TPA: serine hydrolase [Gemmatimonadales bacterium]|nr:serine hydrolase [Gemmatimonadales bacterium]